MTTLHEARYYESLTKGRVKCTLCPHDCHIPPGGRGACSVRYNWDGKLYTLVYDKIVACDLDPVEKKPLFHFFPGSTACSIATVGCNLRCAFCQNWQLSQWPRDHLPKHVEADVQAPIEPVCPRLADLERSIPGEPITPRAIVERALRAGARSIAYTYVEPTIFYELAYDTAVLARQSGLKNIFVTNGFISEAPLRELATTLDAASIDLKFFKDESYRHISLARLQPVLDAIRLYHELGVWVEVTTLVIPGVNDSEAELRRIAEFLVSVSHEIPWHISQFYPAYRMSDLPPTPMATLSRAYELGKAAGLRYVYSGNVPGTREEKSYCYDCGALLIDRYGFYIRKNHIRMDRCPECGAHIDGVGLSP